MRIMLVGGGSGGHITPLLAVAAELKKRKPDSEIVYVGKRGDKLAEITEGNPNIDRVELVRAGKFRRYHGESWFRRILDIKTILLNARDGVYVLIGIVQSLSLLKRTRPDIIFIKGGFVGVPVGLAARLRHRPFITHDSDTVPGLANKIIGRWAKLHATGMPPEFYTYPMEKIRYVGIPLQADFQPVNSALKQKYRQEIQIPMSSKLLFVIGGGLGARSINSSVQRVLPALLDKFEDLYVVQAVGKLNEPKIKAEYQKYLSPDQQSRVRVFGFISDVFRYSGAADVIITRAGATNLAEFALQKKACIVIPSPHLVGGHQVKNAQQLRGREAAVIIDEAELAKTPAELEESVSKLLSNQALREKLEQNMSSFAKPKAAEELAQLISMTADETA